jgi:hypothetical protein
MAFSSVSGEVDKKKLRQKFYEIIQVSTYSIIIK